MIIDDLTFSKFVGNALPQAKMKAVEKQLLEDGEAQSAIQASIADYEVNASEADTLIGADTHYSQNSGIVESEIVRNTPVLVSDMVNNNSETQNKAIMKIQLTPDEVLKVQELVNAFNQSANSDHTLDENLLQFYLTQCPGSFPEDADKVMKGLHSGIDMFNQNLQKALSQNGLDCLEELRKIADELPQDARFEIYVNFLAALSTLNMDNMTLEQLEQIESYQAIRERLTLTENPTEEDLKAVEEQIAQLLENNTLCLGSIDCLKNIIDVLPGGDETIQAAITGSKEDVKQKLVLSMATYIACEKGDIASVKDEQLTPEIVAISTATGVEESKVISDLNAGRTTLDVAIHILKILGGVALFCLLMYFTFIASLTVSLLATGMSSMLLGASTVATVVAASIGIMSGFVFVKDWMDESWKVVEGYSRFFDRIVKVWRETAWPAIKKSAVFVFNWFTSLFSNGKLSRQNLDNTQQNPVMA